MPEMNRRRFLIASAGVGAAGLLSTAVAVEWPDLMRAAEDRPLAEGAGVLVIVSLYGGNDGINTLIPYADKGFSIDFDFIRKNPRLEWRIASETARLAALVASRP